jgi:hypothetical protein
MVHAPRLGRQFGDLGDRELRRRAIAKEVYQPVNLVSGRDVQGVGSNFRYYAGDFMRRDDRETALALFVGPGWVPRKRSKRRPGKVTQVRSLRGQRCLESSACSTASKLEQHA